MRSHFIILLFIISSIFSYSLAQNIPDSEQLSAYNQLNAKYKGNIEINWNQSYGTPDIITFPDPKEFDINPAKSSILFIKEINERIKCRTRKDTLLLIKEKEHKNIHYFHFQQMYEGVSVKSGEYVVTVSEDGKVQMALGFFYKDIQSNSKPQLSLNDALQTALKNPPKGINLKNYPHSSELIIFPKDNKYYLAYELHIRSSSDDESWCYIIDAFNGQVLKLESDMINASKAYVYLRHPGLDASYSLISPLDNLSNNGYIRGTYAYILNDEGSAAYNVNNDFRYSTSNTHFDEANLYYHIDRFRVYMNTLGFNSFTQIIAHAHHDFYYNGNPSPNASYDPTDHNLRFSDGQGVAGFNSFAREDKIIYHEYTHAVTDYIADLSPGYTESGAIHEGNSDYFAGSFTERSLIGEYSCAGYSEYWRDMTDPKIPDYSTYLSGDQEPHDGGELWSACLWNIRTNITASIADENIFDGLFTLPTTSTFLQYRSAIINADVNNNNGCNANEIKHLFYLKGIGEDQTGITVNGTLQHDEIWYCTVSLAGDVYVPGGFTLYLSSTATINLNDHSIISTGGTINPGIPSATINGLRAYIKTGSTTNGIYSKIQTACNNQSGNSEVRVVSGTFNENISVSGKTGLILYGIGPLSSNINGTLTFNNSPSLYLQSFTCKGINLNGCVVPTLSNIRILSTGNTLQTYNCSSFSIDASVHNASYGFSSHSSNGFIEDESYLTNNGTAVIVGYGSNLTLFSLIPGNIELCNSTYYHLYAVNNSFITAVNCKYDNGIPRTYQGSGSHIDIFGSYSCGTPKIAGNINNGNSVNLSDQPINQSTDLPQDMFRIVNSKYFDLLARVHDDMQINGFYDQGKYITDFANVITDFKIFIDQYPNSDLTKTALTTAVHCFKQSADYEGMKAFLQSILTDQKLVNLNGLAKRYMIDYFITMEDFKQALEIADEILTEKKSDAALTCDVLYAKGLIYNYDLNDTTNAVECLSNITKNYPDEQLANLAANQLQVLGYESEKGTTETVVPENLEFSISNYPNPFNPTTTISYKLPEMGQVKLQVFDMLGRLVNTLVNEQKSAGSYTAVWDGSHLSSGTYFLRLRITDSNQNVMFDKTKKMLLTK